MARTLGRPDTVAPPPAVRAPTPGWRDPRMWVGVAIVAVSVVAGARLLAAADDTVAVWGVTTDMGAGARVTEDDLAAQRVRFADGDDSDRYFTVDDGLPADLELLRGVGQGELLPRAAVGPAADTDTLEVPISIEAGRVPVGVDAGSVIDIYIVARPNDPDRGVPGGLGEAALRAVTVVAAPALDDTFGTSGRRQLDLAVPEPAAKAFFELLNSFENPVLTVLRRS
ncbi:MAG: hypothetical protein Q8O61_01660 [Nocardioides sp.]|nr:hypothetical protein [Nocardioides sp.]